MAATARLVRSIRPVELAGAVNPRITSTKAGSGASAHRSSITSKALLVKVWLRPLAAGRWATRAELRRRRTDPHTIHSEKLWSPGGEFLIANHSDLGKFMIATLMRADRHVDLQKRRGR